MESKKYKEMDEFCTRANHYQFGTYIKDDVGIHRVVSKPGAKCTCKVLVAPSEKYLAKMAANKKRDQERRAVEAEHAEAERLIQERMRTIAVQQLVSEGVLNTDGSVK